MLHLAQKVAKRREADIYGLVVEEVKIDFGK
jgi:hypothetical protein